MYQYKATIDRVIDGDTAVLDVDLGFYITMKLHFRFYGINTPEKGKPGWTEATNYVKTFFEKHPTVVLNCFGQDKYGRWLADIIDPTDGGTLNKQITSQGLGVVYLP